MYPGYVKIRFITTRLLRDDTRAVVLVIMVSNVRWVSTENGSKLSHFQGRPRTAS